MPTARPAAPSGSNTSVADYSVMVLLVDDQFMVAEAIRRCLANQPNIDFHYCIDPTEAVRLANQIKPTVILQDLVMPGIDGLTLIRQFRANPGTQETPIIVLSTKEEPTIKAQACLRRWRERSPRQAARQGRAHRAHPLSLEGPPERNSAR